MTIVSIPLGVLQEHINLPRHRVLSAGFEPVLGTVDNRVGTLEVIQQEVALLRTPAQQTASWKHNIQSKLGAGFFYI